MSLPPIAASFRGLTWALTPNPTTAAEHTCYIIESHRRSQTRKDKFYTRQHFGCRATLNSETCVHWATGKGTYHLIHTLSSNIVQGRNRRVVCITIDHAIWSRLSRGMEHTNRRTYPHPPRNIRVIELLSRRTKASVRRTSETRSEGLYHGEHRRYILRHNTF